MSLKRAPLDAQTLLRALELAGDGSGVGEWNSHYP